MSSPPTAPESAHSDYDALFASEWHGLVYYFRRAVRDEGLAEDLAQETFLRAARGWATFRGDCAPRTWLRHIAANVLRDQWRSGASGEGGLHQSWTQIDDLRLADPRDSPALALERRQVQTCLGGLVAQLPPGEREVLLLAVRDAMSPREIARSLRLAPEAARARLHRARRKLAAMVTDRCTLLADQTGTLSCEARTHTLPSLLQPLSHISPA